MVRELMRRTFRVEAETREEVAAKAKEALEAIGAEVRAQGLPWADEATMGRMVENAVFSEAPMQSIMAGGRERYTQAVVRFRSSGRGGVADGLVWAFGDENA